MAERHRCRRCEAGVVAHPHRIAAREPGARDGDRSARVPIRRRDREGHGRRPECRDAVRGSEAGWGVVADFAVAEVENRGARTGHAGGHVEEAARIGVEVLRRVRVGRGRHGTPLANAFHQRVKSGIQGGGVGAQSAVQ